MICGLPYEFLCPAEVWQELYGEPQAVVISLREYNRLSHQQQPGEEGKDWRGRVDRLRERVARELGGRPLPPAEDIIRRMREERDGQILDSLR